jgi:hypothetical protein
MDLVFQPAGKLFTADEYWAIGETEYRCELQEGMIVPRPSRSLSRSI